MEEMAFGVRVSNMIPLFPSLHQIQVMHTHSNSSMKYPNSIVKAI
jgi:hypothetical protein